MFENKKNLLLLVHHILKAKGKKKCFIYNITFHTTAMEAIRDACEGSWAINGDFNLILNEADKNNGCTYKQG